MTNTQKLKSKIKKSGYKISFIAEKMGISRQALSNKINGNNNFVTSEMFTMGELLKLSDAELREIFFDSM